MLIIRCAIALAALMTALAPAANTYAQAADEASTFVGTWRGESVCVAKNTACHNETVVYRVTKLPDRSDDVSISADKIVNGNAINMGLCSSIMIIACRAGCANICRAFGD